jgi:hypothetical protein
LDNKRIPRAVDATPSCVEKPGRDSMLPHAERRAFCQRAVKDHGGTGMHANWTVHIPPGMEAEFSSPRPARPAGQGRVHGKRAGISQAIGTKERQKAEFHRGRNRPHVPVHHAWGHDRGDASGSGRADFGRRRSPAFFAPVRAGSLEPQGKTIRESFCSRCIYFCSGIGMGYRFNHAD